MGITTNENKIPESFSSIKSKMNSRIRFTIEMMNEALEDICKNKELYSAKDRLKVTNKANGKSISCKVNDRGGFGKYGRTIDMSYGAFTKIAHPSKGVIKVTIKQL